MDTKDAKDAKDAKDTKDERRNCTQVVKDGNYFRIRHQITGNVRQVFCDMKYTKEKYLVNHVLCSFSKKHFRLANWVYTEFCKQLPNRFGATYEYSYRTTCKGHSFNTRYVEKDGTTFQISMRDPPTVGRPYIITIYKLNEDDYKKIDKEHDVAHLDSTTGDDKKTAKAAIVDYCKLVETHGAEWDKYPVYPKSWEDKYTNMEDSEYNIFHDI